MSLVLLIGNILEASVVTATSELTPVARLFDRDPTTPWMATSAAQQDIDADQGVTPAPVSYLGLSGYAITTNIQIHSGAASPSNLRATITPASPDPRLVALGGSWSDRFVRARILTGGVTPEAGELMLGTPWIITQGPTRPSPRGEVGASIRERTVGGRLITTQLNDGFDRLRYHWPAITEPNVAQLRGAWNECGRGSKAMLVQDTLGVVRWMAWVDDEFEPRQSIVNNGVQCYELDIVLETAGG